MCLEFRVGFNLREETGVGVVDVLRHGVPVGLRIDASTVGGNGLHHIFVQLKGLFEQRSHILENLHSLFEVVVDVGCLSLNLLLKLLEVVLGLDFHNLEDDSRQNSAHPQTYFKNHGAHSGLDRELLFNDVHITSGFIHNRIHFVQFVCHSF